MNFEKNTATGNQIYYRLITLWVISEGVAGGIAHGLKIPFSGIFLSGFAVMCICLIGYYGSYKEKSKSSGGLKLISHGAILKATIIVCIFKMMLSPNSPPSAYFAVFFQGFIGQILFLNLRHFRLSCILLGFLALVESAIQRIFVLVLLYGVEFWSAVNDFIRKLTNAEVVSNYSLWLAIVYVSIHGAIGILIGIWVSRIITKSQSWKKTPNEFVITPLDNDAHPVKNFSSHKRNKIIKFFFIFIWILLLLVFFQSLFKIGKPILPSSKALQIFLRSIVIVLTWYFLVSPLVSALIKKKLKVQKKKSQTDMNRIILLLPSTENIFRKSWKFSASQTGLKRLGLFWKIVLMNVLIDEGV